MQYVLGAGGITGLGGTTVPAHNQAASTITTGTLAHERGGLEADVSAYAGFPLVSGGATTEIKCNFVATAAPGSTDDDSEGYAVGSQWIDVTNDNCYTCVDATEDAAVWKQTNNS